MPLQLCPKCNRFHYVPGECPTAAGSPSGKAPGFGPGTAGSNPAPAATQQVVSRLKGEKPIAEPKGPAKKSTAALMEVPRIDRPVAEAAEKQRREGDSPAGEMSRTGGSGTQRAAEAPAGTQAPPVDTLAAGPEQAGEVKTTSPAKALKQAEADAAHLAPKSKGGRPRIHPDRKAYKAQKERERRAKLKEAGK